MPGLVANGSSAQFTGFFTFEAVELLILGFKMALARKGMLAVKLKLKVPSVDDPLANVPSFALEFTKKILFELATDFKGFKY